jgi:hypothetical protein
MSSLSLLASAPCIKTTSTPADKQPDIKLASFTSARILVLGALSLIVLIHSSYSWPGESICKRRKNGVCPFTNSRAEEYCSVALTTLISGTVYRRAISPSLNAPRWPTTIAFTDKISLRNSRNLPCCRIWEHSYGLNIENRESVLNPNNTGFRSAIIQSSLRQPVLESKHAEGIHYLPHVTMVF